MRAKEAEIDEVAVDGIELFAGFLELFEAAFEVLAGSGVVSGDGGLGGSDGVGAESFVVEVAELPHVAGEYLNLPVHVAEGDEVGDEIGIDRWFLSEWFEDGRDERSPFMLAVDDRHSFVAAVFDPFGGDEGIAMGRDNDETAGLGSGGIVGAMPQRERIGRGQQLGMPEDGPGIEESLGGSIAEFGGEVLKAVAGDQDVEFVVSHC